MGYGSRALQALNAYYSGEFFNLDEASRPDESYPDPSLVDDVSPYNLHLYSLPHPRSPWQIHPFSHFSSLQCFFAYPRIQTFTTPFPQSTSLLTDKPTIRAANAMPPLLQRLSERKPETLDYLGVSYGLTPQLLR